MARLRKGVAYRRLERPYTRKSKFKAKNFVRATPSNKIVRYDMGDPKKDYELTLNLVSKDDIQVRHNAIEAARQTSNRALEKNLGKNAYHLKIRVYPFHVLRENPLATGAGADRMSTGMKMSFGKPIGLAAQVRKGQVLMTLRCNRSALKTAKLALTRAARKLPCSCRIEEVVEKKAASSSLPEAQPEQSQEAEA
ncbi:50S ribosomal protein L16 [Candidatus Woesearchaeota archaeon]|nr:MAG: 50S ribosomal protein L16 [Candidatus Woesearchaeota archaeon]